jgi:tetratricopeptide (TPR) repeat protein
MFQNRRKDAIKFLEESGYKPDILVELYTIEKQYDKAIALCDKIYKEEGDLEYLSKIAILEYENATRKSPALLESVTKKFDDSIDEHSDALYLNYYGYLLIDHDIDIPKGLELVRKALIQQPDSPYYQDSLAWGLYKQQKCVEAFDIIKAAAAKISDKEITEHLEKIQICAAKELRDANITTNIKKMRENK